jgi:hypothetical protein
LCNKKRGTNLKNLTAFTLALALAGLLSGCQRHTAGATTADIRYRIFEAPSSVVDEAIPPGMRMRIANSAYSAAHPSPAALASLFNGMSGDSGLLVDHSQTIASGPKTADTWAYSKADATLLGFGSGGGLLGVQTRNGTRQISIEYDVTHTINAREPIQSRIAYDGPVPGDGVLIALKPFERTDGTTLVHLIVFEFGNWK